MQKHEIILCYLNGDSTYSIAEHMNINIKTVRRWISRYANTNSIHRKDGSGRPSKLLPKHINAITDLIGSDINITLKSIVRTLKDNHKVVVSKTTIADTLCDEGIKYKLYKSVPLLTERHKQQRV